MTDTMPDARDLLATGEWELTACGLVRKGHRHPPRRPEEDGPCNPVDYYPGSLDRATRWLQEVAKRSEKAEANSYTLKHVAERWGGDYVSNGALIQAALDLGFTVLSDARPNACYPHINCLINVELPKDGVWR